MTTKTDDAAGAGAAGAADGAGKEQVKDTGAGTTVLGGASTPAAGGGNDAGAAGQGTDAGAGGDDKGGEDKDKAAVVPEKYEFKLPEGYALSDEARTELEAYAKETKQTQEQAQKGLNLHVKMVEGALAQVEAQIKKTTEEVRKAVYDETMKFLGADAEKKMADVGKMFAKYGTPELTKWFKDTGAGNNVELVKLMMSLARVISPDTLVNGKPVATKKAPEDALFPTTASA